jgi:hypothetical protein
MQKVQLLAQVTQLAILMNSAATLQTSMPNTYAGGLDRVMQHTHKQLQAVAIQAQQADIPVSGGYPPSTNLSLQKLLIFIIVLVAAPNKHHFKQTPCMHAMPGPFSMLLVLHPNEINPISPIKLAQCQESSHFVSPL